MNERVSSLPTRYYFWTGFIIIVIIIYILLMTIYVKPVTIDTNDVIDANKIKNENENEITIITTREEQSPKEKEKEKALVLQTYPDLNSAALFFSGRVSCFHDSYLFLRTNFLDRFSTCHLYFSLNLDEKDPETRNHLQDIYETYDHDKLTPEQIQQYIDEDLHVELISEPQKRLGHIQRIQVSVYSPPEEWTRWIPLNREELLLKNSTHQLRVGSMYFNNWRAMQMILAQQHTTYNVVWKYRSDIMAHQPLWPIFCRTWSEMCQMGVLEKRVAIPEQFAWSGLNDQIAFGSMAAMKQYADCYHSILKYCYEQNIEFLPERLLLHHLHQMGLAVHIFGFEYILYPTRWQQSEKLYITPENQNQ